jgi:hypothetical protein
MVRSFAIAAILSCLAAPAWAQAQPAPEPAATQAGPSATKPSVKKPAPKTRNAAKPSAPAENGPCQLGVIPALGDQFVVQKVGLTVFGNERTEVPVNWGFDDLVFARARAAAAPGTVVRRLAYAKGTFEPYYNPPSKLFRSARDDLTAIVRQIAGNANCERYVVVVTFAGTLPGTNQSLSGIGVFNRGTSLLSHSSLFANVHVTVFDGRTFAIGKNPYLNLGSIFKGSFARDPLTELDNASFPEPASEAANSATLRDRVRTLLTAKLDETLPAFLKEE